MLAYRLVKLIENNSDALATGLIERLGHSSLADELKAIPPQELKLRVYEIYSHLNEWLLQKTESEIEERYLGIGLRRAQQGVPLSAVVYVIVSSKEHLWHFLTSEVLADRATELFGELEILQLLNQFYDRALYFVAKGYETGLAAKTKEQPRPKKAG